MDYIDNDGNATATGRVGPERLRWTYMRPYGAGDTYKADMYRADGSDNLHFLKVGEPVPREAEDGTLNLDFGTKGDVEKRIQELTWLLENWGKVGRDI